MTDVSLVHKDDTEQLESGDGSVVRSPDSVAIERSRVRVTAGAAGEFSSPGSTFCADSHFGIDSPPVLRSST